MTSALSFYFQFNNTAQLLGIESHVVGFFRPHLHLELGFLQKFFSEKEPFRSFAHLHPFKGILHQFCLLFFLGKITLPVFWHVLFCFCGQSGHNHFFNVQIGRWLGPFFESCFTCSVDEYGDFFLGFFDLLFNCGKKLIFPETAFLNKCF